MRITEIRGHALVAPLRQPFAWPDGRATHRHAGVVEVRTDAGLTGWGPAEHGQIALAAAKLAGDLAGRSPLDTGPIWHDLTAGKVPLGVRSALDIALWDVKGQALGLPIHRLLGGALRHRVPAYATGGYYLLPEDSLGWLRDQVAAAVATGFRAYKMKMGLLDLADDLRRVDAVREVLGPERWLAVDATTTYDLSRALCAGRELEPRGIAWFEDPLPADDVEGYARLSAMLRLPVTAHYGAHTAHLADLIRRRAVAQVQPAVYAAGGFTRALPLIGMTELHGVVLKPSCWATDLHLAATLHLLALLPSLRHRVGDDPVPLEFDTSENPLRDDGLLAEPVVLDADGTVAVPAGPGLGVLVDADKLARYADRAAV